MHSNSSFCSLPFVHSCTNVGGRNKPCCRFQDKKYTDNIPPIDYFYGNKLKELRTKMIKGDYISGCEKCYQDEKTLGISYRTWSNQYFHYDINNPKIQYIEIGLSNLCNLSCVTCNAKYSTSWYKDAIQLNKELNFNIDVGQQKYIKTSDNIIKNFNTNDIKYIKILGGEPFYEKNNLKFLKHFNLKNITLEIVTNGTILPNNTWLDIFNKCKQIYLTISIDGINSHAEFIRFGTKWENYFTNLIYFQNLKKNNFKITYNYVVNCFNIFNLKDFLLFKSKNDLNPCYIGILQKPDYLNVKYLFPEVKKIILQKIENLNVVNVKDYLNTNLNIKSKLHMNNFINYYEFLSKRRNKIIYNKDFQYYINMIQKNLSI